MAQFDSTIFTASQRILRFAIETSANELIDYHKRDLESFFKVFLQWKFNLKPEISLEKRRRDAFNYWKERIQKLETWTEEELKATVVLFLDHR